jgi:16S rRNA (adenine1518-N6/adenine1519-N6)-dimethyltransferase
MHNLKPKKHLGQHFLKDPSVATRIVGLLSAGKNDTVVEIGPGQGVLTRLLFGAYARLLLIEVDPEAVAYLRAHYADQEVEILHQDVLQWQMAGEIPTDSFFIGNLPYNISSPFFFHLLERLAYIQEGVFMIQKEVAERICATEGSKTYGILSVLLGAYFEREYAFSVPPGVFRPPPRVMSGVIRLRRKAELPPVGYADLKQVVKAAFGKRRKTLRNALKALSFSDFPEKESWFAQRAEQLSIASFLTLTRHLQA